MCGIAGLTRFGLPNVEPKVLQEMGEAILHRGPDAGGEFIAENIGLCHRRLAIIDLSEAGNQPMLSADEKLVIAFNGEIYNFLELRKELEVEGYKFRTKTDTEVILALYERDGEECLKKLNGMFAFALWDVQKNQLFLARDRLGKKPLYYHCADGNISFASELKSLIALDLIPKSIRTDAVWDFFAYQYIPDPKTIFDGVFKLPAGHYMVFDKNGAKINQYWDVSFSNTSDKDETALCEDLQSLAEDCTKRRTIADVPLGAFLSGGVDSSGVVALMAKNSDKPIKTCSIGFDEKKFNETEFAKIVADKYQTEHFELTVHENVTDNLEHIAGFFDEPFADPSLVPTYFVSQLAREKVTVAVAGDGGDEVFAGYEKYSTDHIENKLRNFFPKSLRQKVFPALSRFCRKFNAKLFRKAGSLLHSLSLDPAMGFYVSNSMISDEHWNELIKPEVKAELGNYHPSKLTTELYAKADGPDHLSKILYTDIKSYLCGGILVKVDRMSMANSLEVRAPILDYKMLEFAATVPSAMKFKDGEKKHLLKEAFKPLLPDDILYRKKMGFSVPLANWLRSELKEIATERLLNRERGLRDYFKVAAISKLWHEHQSEAKDHSTLLWSMLLFQLWWDRYMEVNQ